MPRTGLDGNLMSSGAAADLDYATSNRHAAALARAGQAQDSVDGARASPWIARQAANPAAKPASQHGRWQRSVNDVDVWHLSLDEIVVLTQPKSVARQGDLDRRAGGSQWSKHVQPETATRIFAGEIVLVDDGVANAEAVEAPLEIGFGQAQEGAQPGDAGVVYLDSTRCPSTASAALPGEMQQDPLGNVASVVGQHDGAKSAVASRLLQCVIPSVPETGFIPSLDDDRRGQRIHAERLRPCANRQRLARR